MLSKTRTHDGATLPAPPSEPAPASALLSSALLRRAAGVTALACAFAASCAPQARAPVAASPPAELAPEPVTPERAPEPPPLPTPPDVDAPPPGPTEMLLDVAREQSAAEVGALDVADGVTLTLHVAPCRIAEAEPSARFEARADCRAVNRATVRSREQTALVVPPGTVRFVVENTRDEGDAGFWLRADGRIDAALVSAGGIAPGASLSWDVPLEPGTYTYACPLSPTPDYTLIVR